MQFLFNDFCFFTTVSILDSYFCTLSFMLKIVKAISFCIYRDGRIMILLLIRNCVNLSHRQIIISLFCIILVRLVD